MIPSAPLIPPFGDLDEGALARLSAAADGFCDVLTEAEQTPLGEVLGPGPNVQWQHYPPEDLHDSESGVVIFYHSHAPEERCDAEHGHFHCFVETSAIAADVTALVRPKSKAARKLCHIVGISIDRRGVPVSLFVTNQWVTGEWLYPARTVAALLPCFARVSPQAPRALRWIAHLVALYEPEITCLLSRRDEILGDVASLKRRAADRRLEIVADVSIDIEARFEEIAAEQARRDADCAT
jgi:hypothetical protein